MNFWGCDDVACIFILSILIPEFRLCWRGSGEVARPHRARSRDADLDLLRPGFLVLGQVHFEHAVFEAGGDFCGAGVIRERAVHSVVAEPGWLWFFGHDHGAMDGLSGRLSDRLQCGRTRFPGAFQTRSVDRGKDRVF